MGALLAPPVVNKVAKGNVISFGYNFSTSSDLPIVVVPGLSVFGDEFDLQLSSVGGAAKIGDIKSIRIMAQFGLPTTVSGSQEGLVFIALPGTGDVVPIGPSPLSDDGTAFPGEAIVTAMMQMDAPAGSTIRFIRQLSAITARKIFVSVFDFEHNPYIFTEYTGKGF